MSYLTVLVLLVTGPSSETPGLAANPTHAWGDFDGDGLPDLYIVQPERHDSLLRNLGDGCFEDVTAKAGLEGAVSRAVSWRDFDGDGSVDLLQVLADGRARLFANQGAGCFVDVTRTSGLTATDGVFDVIEAEWLDYDRDGRPDLRLARTHDIVLLHNDGGGAFEAVRLDFATPLGPVSLPAPVVDLVDSEPGALREPNPVESERGSRRAATPATRASSDSGTAAVLSGPGATVGVALAPPANPLPPLCARSIEDQANGPCIEASSIPTLGRLYPQSPELNVDPSGRVGIGTIAPNARVEIDALGSDTGLFAQRGSGGGAAPVINAVSDAPDNFSSAIKSEINATSGISYSLWARNLSANGFGLFADARHASGPGVGVAGRSLSPAGVGIEGQNPAAGGTAIYGYAASPTGTTTGLRGTVASDVGTGVHGIASSASGSANGVVGITAAPAGFGVRGVNQSSVGIGVQAEGRIGLWGKSTTNDDFGLGVVGLASGSGAAGVIGSHTSTNASYIAMSGVSGSTGEQDGAGVSGFNSGTTGANRGVYGLSLSPVGQGVVGEGGLVGIQGEATGPSPGFGVLGSYTGAGLLGHGVVGHGPTGVLGIGNNDTAFPVLPGVGVGGRTDAPGTAGVFGINGSGHGVAPGVQGFSTSTEGVGVLGSAFGLDTIGVLGESSSGGVGVRGKIDFGIGIGVHGVHGGSAPAVAFGAVVGSASTPGTAGVWGLTNDALGGFTAGVHGSSSFGYGVIGQGGQIGVLGDTTGTLSYGVAGINGYTSGGGIAMMSFGDFVVSGGTKSFAHPHPTDPAKEIRYFCLEGNESGTYFRGTAQLTGGVAVIDVPADFRAVTELDGLTVQVTPRGPGDVWVEQRDLDQVIVRGVPDMTFDYLVQGLRQGFADVEPVQSNVCYRPRERGVPYGAWLRPEIRRRLVENGTLLPDFTPNEAALSALGWKLSDPMDRVEPVWVPTKSRERLPVTDPELRELPQAAARPTVVKKP